VLLQNAMSGHMGPTAGNPWCNFNVLIQSFNGHINLPDYGLTCNSETLTYRAMWNLSFPWTIPMVTKSPLSYYNFLIYLRRKTVCLSGFFVPA